VRHSRSGDAQRARKGRYGIMSVVNTVSVLGNGLYVPFRGVSRSGGPVGTLQMQGQVTGDGSGGAASINFTSRRIEFGFHPMYAATRVHTVDGSATLQNVRFIYADECNERLSHDFQEAAIPVESPANSNHANMSFLGIPIEPIDPIGGVEQNFFVASWETNNNAVNYDMHAFFIVYDLEALAKLPGTGSIDLLIGGIR